MKLCPYCKSAHPVSFDNAIRMRRWNRLTYECPHCILIKEFPIVKSAEGLARLSGILHGSSG